MTRRLVGIGAVVLLAACGGCEAELGPDAEACLAELAAADEGPWPPTAMVHSAGTRIVDGADAPLALRCVNVDSWLTPTPYLVSDSGNALFISPAEFEGRLDAVVGSARAETFWRDWRDTFITEADVERMGALGFNCARLVLYYRGIATLEGGQPALREDRLAYVDAAIGWARTHGLYVVLDLHAAPGGQNAVPTVGDVPSTDPVARLWEGPDAAAHQDATVSLWRLLATRYRDEPVVAGYDLLNEPALPLGVAPGALVTLYERIIAAIREVDPGHMVFVEGDKLAHDFSMFDAPLDANMAYSFHAYALTGLEPWATPELADLQPYLDLRAAHERPLWLGELGEQTQAWQVQVIGLAEAHDVGWALYPWKRKQTLFWNPVVQQIPAAPAWYALASWLARPAGDGSPPPSAADAEVAMAEALSVIPLSSAKESRGLVAAIMCP